MKYEVNFMVQRSSKRAEAGEKFEIFNNQNNANTDFYNSGFS